MPKPDCGINVSGDQISSKDYYWSLGTSGGTSISRYSTSKEFPKHQQLINNNAIKGSDNRAVWPF